MKQQSDLHRTERVFQVGDWVFLRLQPYKQQSLAARGFNKLSPRFFGPYKVLERIGDVAYRLDLPPESVIHPVFHVSYLKAKLGNHNISISMLPSVNSQGILTPEPVAVLQSRSHQLRKRTITQLLIRGMVVQLKMPLGRISFVFSSSFPILWASYSNGGKYVKELVNCIAFS
ncbi:hypothetical protein ACB092_01G041400 [Castanea dentata]